jgi:hypothetical protein
MSGALEALARRVEGDPDYLAYLLRLYADAERLDDPGLTAALGCRPEDLTRLRLCRAPRSDAAGPRADVARIAEHFRLDEVRLLSVVRRAAALRALAAAEPGSRGMLLAARDEETPEDKP